MRLALWLSFIQIIGWGSTYNSPAVLWKPIVADLGIAKEWVFSGTTIMLVLSALMSPRVGRYFDRRGAREAKALGYLLVGAGLAIMARSVDAWTFLLGWAVIGLGTPLALIMTVTVFAHHGGRHARLGMALLTIVTALSPSISWPIGAALEAAIGWRDTLLVFALANALIATPMALLVVPKGGAAARSDDGAAPVEDRQVAPELRERAIVLFAIATALQGFASWGLFLHVIGLMEALGHASVTALALASLLGPASVFARATDLVTSRWLSALDSALFALGLIVAALVLLGIYGRDATLAAVFIVVYSLGAGAMALGRATVPLEIFGRQGYATVIGRVGLPQHLAYAIAPVVFAALLSGGGPVLALGVAAGLSLAALATLLGLRRLAVAPRTP